MKKKRMALAAVWCMFAMTMGCGKEDPILGTWKVDKVRASGVEIDLDEFAEQFGQEQLKDITFTFEDGGKVTGDAADIAGEVTWEANGDTYRVELDGQTMEAVLEDDTLVFEQEGVQFLCARQ